MCSYTTRDTACNRIEFEIILKYDFIYRLMHINTQKREKNKSHMQILGSSKYYLYLLRGSMS